MACSNMSHFSAADKRWMNEHLPAGRYENSEAVMRAMGW
jgi:hypothetical protein